MKRAVSILVRWNVNQMRSTFASLVEVGFNLCQSRACSFVNLQFPFSRSCRSLSSNPIEAIGK